MKCPVCLNAALAPILAFVLCVNAQAPFRVAKSYEDTVRIAILYHTQQGDCTPPLPKVGLHTRNFVVAALDTTKVKQVKIFFIENMTDSTAVKNIWPGKLPHVIVNVNAGWRWDDADPALDWAADHQIGIVEVGDDAASLAANIFGWNKVENVPAPLYDGRFLDNEDGPDSLMIRTMPERDTLINPKTYPYLNGLVHNAIDSIQAGQKTLYFKPPYAPGNDVRCQADADAYTIEPGFENKSHFLGFQMGYNKKGGDMPDPDGKPVPAGYVGKVDEWHVIAAFQDTVSLGNGKRVVRRGVSLSFQPQFLKNTSAAWQITYDAIMFASLAHTLQLAKLRSYR